MGPAERTGRVSKTRRQCLGNVFDQSLSHFVALVAHFAANHALVKGVSGVIYKQLKVNNLGNNRKSLLGKLRQIKPHLHYNRKTGRTNIVYPLLSHF